MIRFFPRAIIVLVVSGACLLSQGCREDESEIEKKIIAYDSSFQEVLDRRNRLREELEKQEASYTRNQQDMDARIQALKEKKVLLKKEFASKEEGLTRQMHPEKRRLENDLVNLKRMYSRMNEDVRNVNRDIKEITSLIDKKEKLALTQEEIMTWNERLASLIKKKETINAEQEKLKNDIEITQLKIKVLGV